MFTKEDYVSLETAKLLKEKGFNEKCETAYDAKGNIGEYPKAIKWFKEFPWSYSRPTLYEAQMWLLEKHNLYLYPAPYLSKDSDEVSWFGIEAHHRDGVEWDYSPFIWGRFITYQQALDAGIREALKLI